MNWWWRMDSSLHMKVKLGFPFLRLQPMMYCSLSVKHSPTNICLHSLWWWFGVCWVHTTNNSILKEPLKQVSRGIFFLFWTTLGSTIKFCFSELLKFGLTWQVQTYHGNAPQSIINDTMQLVVFFLNGEFDESILWDPKTIKMGLVIIYCLQITDYTDLSNIQM